MSAAPNDSGTSVISSEAYDLLDCFVFGIDDLVYEIAAMIAARKNQKTQDGTIEIELNDVKEAAELVFESIRSHVADKISLEAADRIEEMHSCILKKCRVKRRQ